MTFTPMSPEPPKTRPLERFWPYSDLPETPTDEELAAIDPNLHDALFGPSVRRFSVTLVFPALDMPDFSRALDLDPANPATVYVGLSTSACSDSSPGLANAASTSIRCSFSARCSVSAARSCRSRSPSGWRKR